MGELDVRVYLFETRRAEQSGLSMPRDMQESVALAALRGHLVRSALLSLQHAGYHVPVLERWPWLGVAPDWRPGRSDPLTAQHEWFKQLGITDDGLYRVTVPSQLGEFDFVIERLDTIEGSFLGRYRVGVALKGAGKYVRDVSVALLAGLILSSGSDSGVRSPPAEAPYVCTINAEIARDRAELVQAGADDLALPANAPAETRSAVIRARQSCLRAAGFDPGPVDGIEGPRTRRAAEQFAFFHGGLIVNWDSAVFRQFVVEQAMNRGAPRS